MMMIELHSYIGAFRPTDKVRPGFRDRDGTLYVLTHSKPYNKKFVIISTKNIISEHFKSRQDYVYLCESPNQAAHRYNNVPGGKIFFSSHLNSSQMNFVKNLIPTITAEQLSLSPEATVSADDVVLAFVPVDGYEESYNSQTSAVIRESSKAPIFAKAIQARQIEEFLNKELNLSDVEVADEKIEGVIEWINLYYESSDAEKADAATAILQEVAPESLEQVDAGVVAETLQSLIENDTLIVATGLITEEVEETIEEPAADALQITPATAQPTVISRTPGTVELPAKKVSELFVAGKNLADAATRFNDQLTGMIVEALENVAAEQANTVETEDAQINL